MYSLQPLFIIFNSTILFYNYLNYVTLIEYLSASHIRKLFKLLGLLNHLNELLDRVISIEIWSYLQRVIGSARPQGFQDLDVFR
jgi:hypothetical protein